MLLGRRQYVPSVRGVRWTDVRWALGNSREIGAMGLLVVLYQGLDVLLLSRLATDSDVAYYSGAQRLAWPVLMGLSAISGTLYSVLSTHWPHAREQFNNACRRGIEAVFLLGGLAVAATLAGAEFWMRLLGPGMPAGAAALRVLVVLCVVKAFTMTLGPTLLVVRAQRQVLVLIAISLAVKVAVLAPLARWTGFIGVAWGALGVELLAVVVPAVFMIRRYTGFSVRWRTPLLAASAAAGSALLATRLLGAGLAAALVAVSLYVLAILLSGAGRLSDIRLLLAGEAPSRR